ncbi:MAG: hypothetical protein ABI459_04225 [Deltaproteobacteria bacterium]
MFKLNTIIRAGLVTLAGTTAAFADMGEAYITQVQPTKLVVLSNGQDYTKMESLVFLSVAGKLEFTTDTAGRVKSWWAYPEIESGFGGGDVGSLKEFKVSKSYGVGDRPKSISKNVSFSIPASKIADHAVNMCQTQAAILHGKGMSDKEIFGQDRTVSFQVSLKAAVDSTGAGQGNQIWEGWAPKELKVTCAKFKGSSIPQGGKDKVQAPVAVIAATTKVEEIATVSGVCKIKVTTAINTTQANASISYRYEHSSGKKSAKFTVKTAANKIAVVTQTWDIPNGPGNEVGFIKVVGLSPKFSADAAPYFMTCRDKAPGGLTTGKKNGGMVLGN